MQLQTQVDDYCYGYVDGVYQFSTGSASQTATFTITGANSLVAIHGVNSLGDGSIYCQVNGVTISGDGRGKCVTYVPSDPTWITQNYDDSGWSSVPVTGAGGSIYIGYVGDKCCRFWLN